MNFISTEITNEIIAELTSNLSITPLLAFLLINRDLKSPVEAKKFLEPTMADLHDPFLFKDMVLAVERIQSAIKSGEKILIYGDEDIDGISSTVIVMETLQNLGCEVSYIIPNKSKDGIGLREKFIDLAVSEGFSLIITVDCGITNFSQVEYASQAGIDVIISDHHETLAELPKAYAIINPKRLDCTYPFDKLSGAGVAYKLSQAIAMHIMNLTANQWYGVQGDLLNYVMLGTIGDRVPLVGENRIFVKFGFETLHRSNSLWLNVIIEKYYTTTKPISMSTILSLLIPLLSAGESVEGKNISCELLLTGDAQKALEWASKLYVTSQDWLFRARNALEKIKANLNYSKISSMVLLVERDTEIDVLSYCASKLKDILKKPVVMLGCKENCMIGEARAPKGFDLIECFKSCDDLFINYGGHKCAAGFLMYEDDLADVLAKLQEAAAKTSSNLPGLRSSRAEVEMLVSDLNYRLFEDIPKLGPFGEGNPTPVFVIKEAEIRKDYDGYRLISFNRVFWGTRRVRQQLNLDTGEVTRGLIEFFIDQNGRGYISRFQSLKKTNKTENTVTVSPSQENKTSIIL